ncbi:MAG: hypothetical protein Tsb0020_23550 [Haliangiales bacterium]
MLDIRSIADIPFRERDPWSLLNLDPAAGPGFQYADGSIDAEAFAAAHGVDDDDDDSGEYDGDSGDYDADSGEYGPYGVGPDLSYYGFGYAYVDSLWLTNEGDPEPLPPVRNALLLALHTPDDAEPIDDDILLEFWIDDVTCEEADEEDDYAVTVKLSRFLSLWLPKISRAESAIVLAVCNPFETRIVRPELPGVRPIWYPLGNVTSWCDAPADSIGGPGVLRLSANNWLRA